MSFWNAHRHVLPAGQNKLIKKSKALTYFGFSCPNNETWQGKDACSAGWAAERRIPGIY
jgi:hypothetical protein